MMPPQDRDHAVEQWLRQTPIAGARADACLDAETLAAWTEGTLDAPMRAMAEAHAATCGRCQEMLAVMLRTTPVAVPSAGSPVRKWLMMLGPALAAATAVALWIAVDRRPVQPPPVDTLAKQQAPQETRMAPPAEGAVAAGEKDAKARDDSSDRLAKERPGTPIGGVNEAGADKADRREPSASAAAKPAPKPNDEERRRAAMDAAPPPAPPPPAAPVQAPLAPAPAPALPQPVSEALLAREQEKKVLADQPMRQAQSQNQNAANQAAQGPSSVNQAQVNQAASNQAQANQRAQPQSQQEVVTVTAESPAIQTQAARTASVNKAEAGRGGSVQGFAGGRLDTVAGPTFDVAVTDQKARWRVVEGRLVQRSLDQGKSWSTQYAIDSGQGRINAAVCPAAAVCWLAGRSGLVLRTIDGQNWQRLAFSQDVELMSIASTDERRATVTAADGRRFATADGGRTWTPQ